MTASTLLSSEAWRRVRDAYAEGVTAEALVVASGVSRSQFYARAREEGWRRADRPADGYADAAPFEPEAALADPAVMAQAAWRSAAARTPCRPGARARRASGCASTPT